MRLGVVSVAFNGYGMYIPRWVAALEAQIVKPEATLVLGKDHLLTGNVPEWIRIIYSDKSSIGELKNIGIEATKTDYICPLSIDDEILPWATREIEAQTADVLCTAYIVNYDTKSELRQPIVSKRDILNRDFCVEVHPKNFHHGASPFKRSLWENTPYQASDVANALFWIDVALQSPTLARVEIPCLTYNRRAGSHSDVSPTIRAERAASIRNYRIAEREAQLI